MPPVRTILVVDDELSNRELCEDILEPEGHRIRHAESGMSAIRILRDEPGAVDLVLMDVLMPGLDGIEACRFIRNQLALRTLPIVIVTALDDRRTRMAGKEAGADEFLTKPVDATELVMRIASLMRAKLALEEIDRRRERAEFELQSLRDQILRVDRLATLGTLSAGVGHELMNVAVVCGATEKWISEDAAEGQLPSTEALEELRRVTRHMTLHARHLLTSGRPGSDHREMVDLGDVVKAVLSMLAIAGRTRGISVESELPPDPVCTFVSRTRVEQVLVNLIANAADALESVRGERRIVVRVALMGDRVSLDVEDNGVGIPLASQSTIFEPYFTTKSPGKGTGLGLPVVKQIVESMGGTISLASRPEKGTRFSIDVPREAAPAFTEPLVRSRAWPPSSSPAA